MFFEPNMQNLCQGEVFDSSFALSQQVHHYENHDSLESLLDMVGGGGITEDLTPLEPTPIGPSGVTATNDQKIVSASLQRGIDMFSREYKDVLLSYPKPDKAFSSSKSFMVAKKKKERSSSSSSEDTASTSSSCTSPLNQGHVEQWNQRCAELVEFRAEHGHCLVPLHWPRNSSLAHWVKRQRCQYKAKKQGKRTTLTVEREKLLRDLCFVWDSHAASWEERLNELRDFKELRGHCNVPKMFPENQKLAVWVKCQRRQYRLLQQGKKTTSKTMTTQRIQKLIKLGFVFEPLLITRNLDPLKKNIS